MEQRSLMKRRDIIIIVAIVLICAVVLVWYSSRKPGDVAVITFDGKTVKEISLTDADQLLTLQGNDRVHFEMKDHAIRFVDVDCPDKICENVGYISKQGETAVCMPNKTTLTIISSKGETDIIVQ